MYLLGTNSVILHQVAQGAGFVLSILGASFIASGTLLAVVGFFQTKQK